LKLHRDFINRFVNEKNQLLILMKILSIDEWLLHDAWTKQGPFHCT
jgi:hypothetical protein